jgi:hypothetical protein
MRSFHPLRPLAVCLVAHIAAATASAATITATANDASGKPVANTILILQDASRTTVSQRSTDARGTATFQNVPAGRYIVRTQSAAPVEASTDVAETAAASVALVVPASLGSVEVTATRLREARIALSPKVGTTVYTLDQDLVSEYGAGADTPMNEVLLRLPGVAQDSKASGSLHVRDEHANVQYRINGIQLPEGFSGFGQSVDSRFVDRIDFLTGALPAQFGLRTAGIVDIETQDGALL